jgi:predicted DNA-binding transcriptional regulator AlpA
MATSITGSTIRDTGRLLRPRELGVPVGTLANWRSARTGPPFVKVGRHVRYRIGDVDEWVAARVFAPETVTPPR